MGIYARVRVAAENYAIPVGHVVAIRELGAGPEVPGAGNAMLGVRNVRGQVVPVADLATLLGVRRQGPAALMLIAEAGGLQVGLAIDLVTDVGELPELDRRFDAGLLSGTVMTAGELVGVIDVPRVVAALEEAARR